MRIAKILHKDEYRIKVDFPYNRAIEAELRQIEGTRWSKTMNAWHIPYTRSAYLQLKMLFPAVEASLSPVREIIEAKKERDPIVQQNKGDISVEINGRKIILKMPRNTADVKFLNTIKYSKWDAAGYFWQIPNYPGNAEMIKNYFGARIGSFTESESISISAAETATIVLGENEVLVIKTKSGRLKLLFGYHLPLQKLLRQIPYHVWDSRNKWWTIPYSEDFLNKIKECISANNLKLLYEEEAVNDRGKPRISPYDIPNYRQCPDEYILKLKELRYSDNTIRTYRNSFEEFINFYYSFDIKNIDETQIITFLRFLVTDRKVSSSYQNQAINAIKFWHLYTFKTK